MATVNSPSHDLRVVKLGGSLLKLKTTPRRLKEWLDDQLPVPTCWIVGGGELVDVVRQHDCEFPLRPETAHWICVDLMGVNARLVQNWFGDWPLVDSPLHEGELIAQNVLLAPGPWLRRNSDGLPQSWDVTSDSIAALVAQKIDATELVLLKSATAPAKTPQALAESGYVDSFFPSATQHSSFKIRFVNLNDGCQR